ncbi:MAG: alpha/beta hydrolase [Oscillospiraceae bacterium]|nr:alpha/beta hydrolase [Oscillospiraceae bacterium]
MTIHEFGRENEKTVVLIHPSVVMWDYFEYVIALLQECYHLIVPALPGYDTDMAGDFTSVEEIASELAQWLDGHGYGTVSCIYGCSMGGAVVLRLLADGRIHAHGAVMDGGITPYRLPWIVTRLIAVRDFLMIYMGKLGGIRLLEKAFSTDEYSDEDLKYAAGVLKMISAKTIWRTFESSNNYKMPENSQVNCERIEYWYAQNEQKARKWDVRYVRQKVPQTVFKQFEDMGHGGLAVLKPELLAAELERVCAAADNSV